jgi:inhibitor of KinA
LILDQGFEIFPLGDCAATFDLGNRIDRALNEIIRKMQSWLARNPFTGIQDVIAGYSSLSVFYDPVEIYRCHPSVSSIFEFVRGKLEEAWRNAPGVELSENGEIIKIPVCYDPEFGQDQQYIADNRHLSIREIVELHQSVLYYVYLIGFLPGFAYMAEIDERLEVPRKPRPVPVVAGSVGIAGSQTGIYPLNCPGGWRIIGRTPLSLVDTKASVPAVLKPGNLVQFYEISRGEYASISKNQL